jgi:hypothetical protein
MKYKVYYIVPRLECYRGQSLVGASSAEEANRIIEEFKRSDPHNYLDSGGYSKVSELHCLDGIWAEGEGIIHMGIYYYG